MGRIIAAPRALTGGLLPTKVLWVFIRPLFTLAAVRGGRSHEPIRDATDPSAEHQTQKTFMREEDNRHVKR